MPWAQSVVLEQKIIDWVPLTSLSPLESRLDPRRYSLQMPLLQWPPLVRAENGIC